MPLSKLGDASLLCLEAGEEGLGNNFRDLQKLSETSGPQVSFSQVL